MSKRERTKVVTLNKNDEFARYKTFQIELKIEGGGSYLKTVIVNLYDIAGDLSRNPEYLLKYFGIKLNSPHQLLEQRRGGLFNGKFEFNQCDKILDKFIEEYVLCPNCKNPETNIILDYEDKNMPVNLKCRACGETNKLKAFSSKMTKLIYAKHKKPEKTTLMQAESDKKRDGGDENIQVSQDVDYEGSWSVDTSEESIKTRLSEQNIQGISIQDMIEEKKRKEEAVEMTPQSLLTHILESFRASKLKSAKQKGEKPPVPLLKDAHYYYAVKATKDNFKLKSKMLPKLIGEVLIVSESLEEVVEHHSAILCHFIKKDQRKLLSYFRSSITGKYEEKYLKRGSVILFKMYKYGIVDQKSCLDWYKEISAKKTKSSFKKCSAAVRPFFTWLKN